MNVNNFLRKLKSLEKTLDYEFVNKDLLIEALCHPSLNQNVNLYNQKTNQPLPFKTLNYERLELLGDSVLSFIITEILFLKYPEYNEGKLAKIKGYLVSAEILYKVATKINLADYILMTFGEENSNGRNNPNNLENATEALLAAIYLDSDEANVRRIIKFLWEEFLIVTVDNSISDPKTALQEWSQREKFGIPLYERVETIGSSHEPIFTIKVSVGDKYGIAKEKSIKKAEKAAARNLLAIIRNT